MFIIAQGTKQHKPSTLSWFVKKTMHLSAIASLAVSSSMIHAETSQQTTTTDEGSEINRADGTVEPSTTLPTIVVTAETNKQITENTDSYTIPVASSATGLTLSAKETPQATSVVTNQQIKDQNSTNLTEVLKRAPGIQVGSIDGARSGFSARGFGITGFQIDGLNTDFVQQAAMGEYSANTAMFDHVEIVRGATGLMSGSGDPSANVNLIRKRADSDIPVTELSANVNRYGNYGISVDRSQALSESGAVRGRVVASYQDGDTFIDRQELGQSLIYATVDADVSDNTTVSVGASRQHNKSKSTMWGGLPSYLSDGSKADWDTSTNASPNWSNWDSDNVYYFADIDHDFNEDWNLTTKASYNESDSSPKLLYLYANGSQVIDPDVGLVYNLNPFHADTERKQVNVKTELTGNFDALGRTHKLIVGGSYNKSDLDTFTYTAPPDGLLPVSEFADWDGNYPEPAWGDKTQSSDVTIKEKAIFAATQLKLSDPLSVILGSRVSDYERSGVQYGRNVNTESKHIWTPYAGITYDINKNHSLYTSYSDIFKPQTQRDIKGDYLDPIEGKNYEIGLKSESDTGALQSQVSLFRIEQDNLAQLDGGQIIPGTSLENAYVGAKGATSQGVEVEVTGELSDKLKATIGYTHFNAEDKNGKAINTGYADTTLNVFATYDLDDVVPNLTIGGGIDWSNGYYGVVTNPVTQRSEKYGQDDVTLASIMAKYAINKNLDAQLNVNNLFNQKYLAGENFFGLTYGEPLNVVGRLTYRF
ncbi:TonB-dependent siderophore receptor [Psychrobacter alimentarius]|uniref:TonB-dependent siderophore receptor n=1 Tax=Psychrobacter alimentarius TaxID=261164 RepID=UPI003FCF63B7